MAYRILVPWQGIKFVLPAVQVWSLSHWTAGKSLCVNFEELPNITLMQS